MAMLYGFVEREGVGLGEGRNWRGNEIFEMPSFKKHDVSVQYIYGRGKVYLEKFEESKLESGVIGKGEGREEVGYIQGCMEVLYVIF